MNHRAKCQCIRRHHKQHTDSTINHDRKRTVEHNRQQFSHIPNNQPRMQQREPPDEVPMQSETPQTTTDSTINHDCKRTVEHKSVKHHAVPGEMPMLTETQQRDAQQSNYLVRSHQPTACSLFPRSFKHHTYSTIKHDRSVKHNTSTVCGIILAW